MELEIDTAQSLFIKRHMLDGKAQVNTEVLPGSILVLKDEVGGTLSLYERLLTGKKVGERIWVEMGGVTIGSDRIATVGYGAPLPTDGTLVDYFIGMSVPEDEVGTMLEHFELGRYAKFHPAHLPQVPSRQVELLSALYRRHPIVVMNDPFQPFSGRWREEFARRLLEVGSRSGMITICTNLSFEPQAWVSSTLVKHVDVGTESRKAMEQAAGLNPEKKDGTKDDLSAFERDEADGKKVPYMLPENIVFAYREAYDRIFEPLAQMARFMRSNSAIVASCSMVFLVLVMGFVMFPHMGAAREKLALLAEKYDYPSLGDLLRGSDVPPSEGAGQATELQSGDIARVAITSNGESIDLEFLDYSIAIEDEPWSLVPDTTADLLAWSQGGVQLDPESFPETPWTEGFYCD